MDNFKEIIISRMCITDIKYILEIQNKCQLSPWTPESYAEELKRRDSILLAAKLNNRIEGFLLGRLLLPRQLKENIQSFTEAEILNFGVSLECQKKGIGGLLLEQFLSEISRIKVDSVWLEVRINNSKAIKFYENRGFVKVQVRKRFYERPTEDALVMKYVF